MSVMTNPIFIINKYIQDNNSDKNMSKVQFLTELKDKLYKEGIHMKHYESNGLFMLYHKYEAPCTTTMQRECRSVIFDDNTCEMIAYSGEVPMVNKEGLSQLLLTEYNNYNVNISYEGSLLSVFYHNDRWYVSTRRCLDSRESKFNSDKTHYDMFCDVIMNDPYKQFETSEMFFEQLDKNYSYYFVLIHHLNKNIIDYTYKFGDSYTKACLIAVRDKHQQIKQGYTPSFVHTSWNKNFFVPEYVSLKHFDETNNNLDYSYSPIVEGIIIESLDPTTHKRMIFKLQTLHYQFYQATKLDNSNVLKGLLLLYKNDKLFNYLENPKLRNLRKIHNTTNTHESYNIISVFNSIFKVCSVELLHLFKELWNIKTGEHKHKMLYDILPKEYKEILFKIRGIYYEKKSNFLSKNTNEVKEFLDSHLKFSDIYNLLKNIDINTLYSFLRMRKMMHKKCTADLANELSRVFMNTGRNCLPQDMKLIDIITNNLFPDITASMLQYEQ
jgi:hypothetical protein